MLKLGGRLVLWGALLVIITYLVMVLLIALSGT